MVSSELGSRDSVWSQKSLIVYGRQGNYQDLPNEC